MPLGIRRRGLCTTEPECGFVMQATIIVGIPNDFIFVVIMFFVLLNCGIKPSKI